MNVAQAPARTTAEALADASIFKMRRPARYPAAITQHALIHPDTNVELSGQIRCGLEPNTFYIGPSPA